MNKKVYFAGSIRGGRQDAELYQEIIAHIKETDTVLTEHIGNLSISVLERGRDRDGDIYRQDTEWLRDSDIVIAECTNPSLGVGYELAYAEARNIPVHIFYRKEITELSAMLTGNPYFFIHPYVNKRELFETIDGILTEER